MDKIYHEKQVDRFCAQHCLNSLLQGPYFTLESLVEIAHNLDDRERMTRNSQQSDCLNNDESGDFSIQVITMALQNFGLELVPYMRKSPEAEAARADPTSQRAFICHFDMHWLAIRRLGNQWFDLNSLRTRPQLISNTYLSMYLAQLNSEKYSIWFVTGNLPECEADEYLMLHPLPETYRTKPARILVNREVEDDPDLKKALQLSLKDDSEDASLQSLLAKSKKEAEDRELLEALLISAKEAYPTSNSPNQDSGEVLNSSLVKSHDSVDDCYFNDRNNPSSSATSQGISVSEEDRDLKEAIRLSLEESAKSP